MNQATTAYVAELQERTAYWLAGNDMADCASPDSLESPGALLLTSTRDSMVEAIESDEYDGPDDEAWHDRIHEYADNAPDVYTHTRWREFVDLAAYLEECESGEWPDDLTDAAGVALYQIAERLCQAILNEWRDKLEAAEDEGEEDPDDAEESEAVAV